VDQKRSDLEKAKREGHGGMRQHKLWQSQRMKVMMRFGLHITVLHAVGEGTSILPVRSLIIREGSDSEVGSNA
jgi:hypothetical protein